MPKNPFRPGPDAPRRPQYGGYAAQRRLTACIVVTLCLAALVFSFALAKRLWSGGGGGGTTAAVVTQDEAVGSVRGSNIPVTVTLPAKPDGAPLVVLCHGFTGNRQLDGHAAPLARLLAQKGIAVAALDFAGNGDSAEPFTAYDLKSMYDDIDSVIGYMQATYAIDPAKVGLVGHSMGGRAVTMHLNSGIAAAALWSPADADGLDGLEFIDHTAEGRDALRAAAGEAGSYAVPGWNVTISAEFVEQMASSHPLDELKAYQGPLLLAFAGGDTDVLSQATIDATLQAAKDRGAAFTDFSASFANTTHNYAAVSGDEKESKTIAAGIEQQTADFLIAALLPAAQ